MRRIAILTALTVVGVMAARALAPRLHDRMLATCERMFEQMPEGFPPKRMLHGLEEARTNTARILELLEERDQAEPTAPLSARPLMRANEMEVVVT